MDGFVSKRNPLLGTFLHAPPTENGASRYFQNQIIPIVDYREKRSIRANPFTGTFHAAPGNYSELHSLRRKVREIGSFHEDASTTSSPAVSVSVSVSQVFTNSEEPAQEETRRKGISVFEYSYQEGQRGDVRDTLSSASSTSTDGGHVSPTDEYFASDQEPPPASENGSDADVGERKEEAEDDNDLPSRIHWTRSMSEPVQDTFKQEVWRCGTTVRIRPPNQIKHTHSLGSPAAQAPDKTETSVTEVPLIASRTNPSPTVADSGHFGASVSGLSSMQSSRDLLSQDSEVDLTEESKDVHMDVLPSRLGVSSRASSMDEKPRWQTVLIGSRWAPTPPTVVKSFSMNDVRNHGDHEVSMPDKAQSEEDALDGDEDDIGMDLDADDEEPPSMYSNLGFGTGIDRSKPIIDISGKDIAASYSLEATLGSGAFADLKRGIEIETKKEVAIKCVRKRYLFTKEERASIAHEVDLMRMMHHPNIVELHQVFEDADHVYLVMELVKGTNLDHIIKARRQLSENETRSVFAQLFDAIDFIHSKDVVHCDIKPENIMVAPAPELEAEPVATQTLSVCNVVKVCDFGNARRAKDPRYYKQTGNVSLVPFKSITGTQGFIAPEILNHKHYGKAVDMWSLGILLYQLLVGFEPFYPYSTCLTEDVEFPSPYWDSISANAKDLISRLLDRNASTRITVREAKAHPWLK